MYWDDSYQKSFFPFCLHHSLSKSSPDFGLRNSHQSHNKELSTTVFPSSHKIHSLPCLFLEFFVILPLLPSAQLVEYVEFHQIQRTPQAYYLYQNMQNRKNIAAKEYADIQFEIVTPTVLKHSLLLAHHDSFCGKYKYSAHYLNEFLKLKLSYHNINIDT